MPAATLRPPALESWPARRVLVVVAHPDDEVLGCGALLVALRDARVVQVTNGASRDPRYAREAGFATPVDYAAARRVETLAALTLAGIAEDRLTNLGIDDQAVHEDLAGLAQRLLSIVGGADIVLTHAYEGGHGDHDAVAFAVHAAVRLSPAEHRPAIVEMPFYFAGADRWIRQRFLPRDRWEPPGRDDGEITHVLTADERDLKARLFAAYASQAATLDPFPIDVERFRPAPAYEFTRRPHDGDLLYERHGWSLTWPAWQAAVAHAEAALDLA